jgi:hypothetical protein
MSVMFAQNTDYMTGRSWGYNPADVMYAMLPGQSSFGKLEAVMARNPEVLSVSGSVHHVGKNHTATVLHFPDRKYEVDRLQVGPGYFETMGLELREGRVFNDFEGSDRHAVVVNETFAGSIGGAAIGRRFTIDTAQYEVIGVLKEFHAYTFSQIVRPMIFTVADRADFRFLLLKARPGSAVPVYRSLQAAWSELFPETPFDGGLQQEIWGPYYEQIGIYKLVWRVFAFLAITLATLGLYGLVRLNVEGRTREFSIRKVFGAGLKNISASVTNQYLILFTVALCAGAPLGHVLGSWLVKFSDGYHMPINPSGAILSVGITAFVLLATVSVGIWRVLKSSPLSGLKVE